MTSPNDWARSQAVSNAQAVVSGELGVLEGSIALHSLAHQVVDEWYSDPDFSVLVAVASEVDDIPFGEVRNTWSAAALSLADAKASAYAALVGPQVLSACRNIIARFDASSSHPAQVLSNPSLERP
jgi:hypothetical protein